MQKRPAQLARSLRAFKNACRLGLLRHIQIAPGQKACRAAEVQSGVRYIGGGAPRLPLAECTIDDCQCAYVPAAKQKLRSPGFRTKRILDRC
jgi:hypothetical protein